MLWNCIFFPMSGAWHVSWMLMHSTITVACSLSLHVPFPVSPPPFLISLSIPLLRALSDLSTITHQPPLYPCIRFFSLKNSNDGRAFTVFTSFKTNMWHSAVPAETFDGSALHSGLSELPALEHSCMLQYTIGQGTRKRVYEIQKKIKKKEEKMGEQGLLVSLIHVLWHISWSIAIDQSLYRKGGDGTDTVWDISDVHTYMIHIAGRLSFVDYTKGRLSFVECLQPCNNKSMWMHDLFLV